MATDVRLKDELPAITDQLVDTYTECSRLNHLAHEPLPNRDAVADIVDDLFEVLYPGYGKRQNLHIGNIGYYVGSLVDALHDKLTTQIARALRHELCHESPHVDCEPIAQPKAMELLRRLPDVRKTLELDVEAAFRGDPAARSHHEIIFCYPGLEAITVYRVAHELYGLGVPFIPRMMTELAHAKTGIDIHPGATIGPGFFIDHGTGVVIGETCDIGQRREAVPGRDARRAELHQGRRRRADARRVQAAPDARRRRGGVRERDDPGRSDGRRRRGRWSGRTCG